MLSLDNPRCPWLYNIHYDQGMFAITYTYQIENKLFEILAKFPNHERVLKHDRKLRVVTVHLPEAKGKGENRLPDHEKLAPIAEALGLLFDALGACRSEIKTESGPYQRLAVMMAGTGIFACLSQDFVKSFETERDVTYKAVSEATKHAHDRMYVDYCDLREFEMYVRTPNRIHLSVPGSASGLDPGYHAWGEHGEEFVLNCHNVDGPVQQLALLAGLAKLSHIQHDMEKPSDDDAD